jgi:hypothetical protein
VIAPMFTAVRGAGQLQHGRPGLCRDRGRRSSSRSAISSTTAGACKSFPRKYASTRNLRAADGDT